MRSLLIALAIVCPCLVAHAQGIAGQVRQPDGAPVPFATLALLRADSTLAGGALADEQGRFSLQAPQPGSYRLRAQALGFTPQSRPVQVGAADMAGLHFTLIPDSKQLAEVEVVGRKPFLVQAAGRTILNVEGSIVATGATALEVLQRAPGVIADQNGNISLKGKSDVLVLIDGKPTQLPADQLGNYLKTLQASQIAQIELITNPDARYDAQGNAGIINIRLRKGGPEGTTGRVSIMAGHGRTHKSNSTVAFSARREGRHVEATYTYGDNGDQFVARNARIQAPGSGQEGYQLYNNQDYYSVRERVHTLAATAGLPLGRRTTAEVQATGSRQRNLYLADVTSLLTNPQGQLVQQVKSFDNNPDHFLNGSGRLTLRHKLGPDTGQAQPHELSAWADVAAYNQISRQNTPFNYTFFAVPGGPRQDSTAQQLLLNYLPAQTRVQVAAIDYTRPLGTRWRLDAGGKTTAVQVRSEAEARLGTPEPGGRPPIDTGRSSDFRYRETIAAAYGSATYKHRRWDVTLGLRLERWLAQGDQRQRSGGTFTRDRLWPFPNVQASYRLDTAHTFSFSYSRRIDRPAYNNLNPIRFFADPFNFFAGNPALRPQLTQNAELAHTLLDGLLVTTLNASRTQDLIEEYAPTPLEGNPAVIGISPQNLGRQDNVGIAVAAMLPLVNEKSPTSLFVNAFHLRTVANYFGIPINVGYNTFNLNLNQQLVWGKGWAAEVSCFYQHYINGGLGTTRPVANLSAGVQRELWGGRGSLRLTATDMLWTQKYRTDRNVGFLQQSSFFRQDSRQVRLIFSYRFGDLKAPKPEVKIERDERAKTR